MVKVFGTLLLNLLVNNILTLSLPPKFILSKKINPNLFLFPPRKKNAVLLGLKRTGKSCRLRWLNYLRPDVRRGNITPDEQLLIMELHAKWGNK